MTSSMVAKGSRIVAQWISVRTVCLAGVQNKLEGKIYQVSGVVRHVRCETLDEPENCVLFIDPDPGFENIPTCEVPGCTCGKPHVMVSPQHVIWVEEPA